MTSELVELANGNLSAWTGIPNGVTVDWVRNQLPDCVEQVPSTLLEWHGGAAGPEGVLMWVEEEALDLIEIPYPSIPLEALSALGEPELILATAWSRAGNQRAWPSRGLAVHASFDGIIRVMAFAPMTAEEFSTHRFALSGQPPQR